MKKIKATLKAGERLLANTVGGTYMISNGAWLLPANVVTAPKKLEYLIETRAKFSAGKDRIDTEARFSFDSVWQPEKEIVGVVEETKILTGDHWLFYRWFAYDAGGEMWSMDNDYYEAIKPWFPYWQGGISSGKKCFYFSKGEGIKPSGKLMGLNAVQFSTVDREHLGKLLKFIGG